MRYLAILVLFVISRPALGGEKPPLKKPGTDFIVDQILKRFDTDGDGKISKSEAKERIAETFPVLDANKDGFVDRSELRTMAQRIAEQKKGPESGPGGPDFDALDRDADGRLSRTELRGPLATRFAEIDADGNGQIDRREFEAFLKSAKK